jgi:peptide/nickel transport system permease protein
MPLPVKLSVLWLLLVVLGAIYAKLDEVALNDALPLQGPRTFDTSARALSGPSPSHILGTDSLRRDTFARLLHGGWVSLVVALTAATFGVVLGGLIGAFVGYVRGWSESIIMAAIDVVLAFPPLILLLALVSIYETRSLLVISLAIGLLSIPAYTRVARANSLAISNRDFVRAARAIGTRPATILLREVVPNVLPTLLAFSLITAASIIVIEGALSFLGLSVSPPTASWGNMISQGRADIKQTSLPVVWPSLALTCTTLALNQVGDWFQRRAAFRSSSL